jgi:hypothetical protein
MNKLESKAILLGASEFGKSKVKNKRFYVVYNNKKINFGFSSGKTYIDHKNTQKKNAWIARHSKIKNKNNSYVIRLKTSPSFWSKNILWS